MYVTCKKDKFKKNYDLQKKSKLIHLSCQKELIKNDNLKTRIVSLDIYPIIFCEKKDYIRIITFKENN